ncbi:MAG: hypothetical protein JKY48_09575 [Flavobacteriales bacterium]|nr:hypothetical protein [Flavobacteriales bacterium]
MSKQLSIIFIGILFWLLFVSALFGGDAFWGLNFSSFLDSSTQITLFALALFFICFTQYLPSNFSPVKNEKITSRFLRFGFLTAGFLLLYSFPIFENVYGDSVQLLSRMGESTTAYSQKYIFALFSLDITNPKLGNLTVLSLVRLLSYGFDISHLAAFQVIGIVSGLLFFNISFSFIHQKIKNRLLQIALLLVVLLSPFNQLFLGHAEIYAPAFPTVAWYLLSLKSSFDTPTKKKIILLILSFILCVKFHYLFILLFPTLLFALLTLTNSEKAKRVLTWRFLSKFLLLPIVLIGVSLYLFVFKDFNDPRFLSPEVNLYDRLFLPVVSPKAPLNHYNLFSLNHLFDFFNISFLWSAVSLFLLLVFSLFYVKKINWNQPILVSTGFLLLLFSMVFFAFNPLLSMPMDFDLFSLAAPFLLFFSFFIVEQIQTEKLAKSISGPLVGISLFSIAIFACNHQKDSLSLRMESIGKHVFKSYWIRSAGDIQLGLNLVKEQPEEFLNRSIEVVEELKPFALEGNDLEYATLLWSVGKEYRKQNEYSKALGFHLKSLNYSEKIPANYIGLMESNYYLEDFNAAYHYSKELIRLQYPTEKRAYEIGVDCALKADDQQTALTWMKVHQSRWKTAQYTELIIQLEDN